MTDARVLKAALVLVAVLASGFALGVAVDRALWRSDGRATGGPPGERGPGGERGPPPAEKVAEHLAERLQLTAEQRGQVEGILREEMAEARAEMDAAHARREALHQRARDRVKALLDDSQRAAWDRLQPMMGPPPGRRPPPPFGGGPPRGRPPFDGPPPHDGPPPR